MWLIDMKSTCYNTWSLVKFHTTNNFCSFQQIQDRIYCVLVSSLFGLSLISYCCHEIVIIDYFRLPFLPCWYVVLQKHLFVTLFISVWITYSSLFCTVDMARCQKMYNWVIWNIRWNFYWLQKIRELISVLDHRKDESIERTFKGVAKFFKEAFSELVPGGHGSLVMMTKRKVENLKLLHSHLLGAMCFLKLCFVLLWTMFYYKTIILCCRQMRLMMMQMRMKLQMVIMKFVVRNMLV